MSEAPVKSVTFAGETGFLLAVSKILYGEKTDIVIGRAVKDLYREHLFKYGRENPNKLGGKSTQFFGKAARSVDFETGPGYAEVYVTHRGIRQQFLGGSIKAGQNGSGKQWLTIPAIAAAHGRSAGDFTNLQFIRFGPAVAALVENDEGSRYAYSNKAVPGKKKHQKATGHKRRVFFWLRKEVNQKPNPDVFPTEAQVMDTVQVELVKLLQVL